MNKEDNREADVQPESLPDLPATGEQAEDTKGGGIAHNFTVTAKDVF